ncbi:uncharacterized protein LOC118436873 [Folsomia candida]|nr:uncharacterized protein LOC118436873 [Folsomia candida]
MDFSDLLVASPMPFIKRHELGGSFSELIWSPMGLRLQENSIALADNDISLPGSDFINPAELSFPDKISTDESSIPLPPAAEAILSCVPPRCTESPPLGHNLNNILLPLQTLSQPAQHNEPSLCSSIKKKRGRPPKLKQPAPLTPPRVKKYDLEPSSKPIRNAIAARKNRIRAKERFEKLEADLAGKEGIISRQNKTIEKLQAEILELKATLDRIEQTLNSSRRQNQTSNFGREDGN